MATSDDKMATPAPVTPAADPWTVQASGGSLLPVGPYMAVFQGVADYPLTKADGTTEMRWRWTWEVASGTHKGRTASALTDQRVTTATHPGRLLTGMLGRPLTPGESLRAAVDGAKGKPFLIRVAPGPKGGKESVQSADRPPE